MPRCGGGRGLLLLASLAVFNVANHPTEGFLQGPAGLGALCGSLGQGICWPAAVRGHAAPQCFMRERQSSAVAAPSGQPNEQIGRWRTRTSFPAVPKQEVQHVLASYTAAPQRADSAVGVRPAAASVAIAERAPELLGHIGRGNGCRLAIYREKRFNARFDEYLLTKRSPDKRFTQEHRTWMHYQRQRHAVGGLSKQRVARFEEEDLDLSLDEVWARSLVSCAASLEGAEHDIVTQHGGRTVGVLSVVQMRWRPRLTSRTRKCRCCGFSRRSLQKFASIAWRWQKWTQPWTRRAAQPPPSALTSAAAPAPNRAWQAAACGGASLEGPQGSAWRGRRGVRRRRG
ncbi:hypothetical protein T484DRAFT_1910220, partial [Baffinella frigidus]